MYQTGAVAAHPLFTAVYGLNPSPLVCETSLTTSMYQTGAVAAHQLFTAVYGLNQSFYVHNVNLAFWNGTTLNYY